MTKQDDKHGKILHKIDQDFAQSHENQHACYQDRRFCFVNGAMWEGDIGEQFKERPKFEFNKIQLAVVRIYNEWARNRFGVQFRPDDLQADKETANTLNSLLRGDERDSNAIEAYANAFMEGISGGIGAFQLVAEYENPYDDSSEQRIRIKPIFEADSTVYWDCNAKRQDKSDARHVTLVVSMTKDDYEDKYGEVAGSFDKLDNGCFHWKDNGKVKVAEFYEVDTIKRKIVKLAHEYAGQITLYQDDDDFEQQLSDNIARGFEIIMTKTIKERVIKGYVISGDKILDSFDVAGEYLPIIPFYGNRNFISGQEVASGHVRLPKDPQRAYNAKMSALIELSAKSHDEKPIFTPEQINGHSHVWASHDVENSAYLTINPIFDPMGNVQIIGPQAYTRPPQIPPALGAIIEKTDQDIHELTGNQAHGEELVSNVSAQAIEMVQTKVDGQAYIYLTHWARSMEQMGRVWLSMAKVLYDEPNRMMSGLTHNDKDEKLTINGEPTMVDGKVVRKNDVQTGRYGVSVDVGEAFSVQRDKAVKQLVSMLAVIQDPATQIALVNTILANQDGEGMQDLAKFARKQLVMAGVAEPTDSEKAELEQAMAQQNSQPNAQEMWMQAEAQKAMANAERQKADTMRVLADTDHVRSETAINLFELQQAQIQQGAMMGQMLAILQGLQQSQAQHSEQIKQEVGGGGQPPIPPEILSQMGQRAPQLGAMQ